MLIFLIIFPLLFSPASLKCSFFLWKTAMMLSSSLSRAASSLSTPRLAAAGPRRDGVVANSSMSPPLLSTSLPTPQPSSRPQLRPRCASSRRATVTARASRGDGYGDRGVTARWCLDARYEFDVSRSIGLFDVARCWPKKKKKLASAHPPQTPPPPPQKKKKKKKKNRFGSKAEAAALLTEWATKIAPQALLDAGKVGGGGGGTAATLPPPPAPSVRVLSGAVGASESRLEIEVAGLSSLAALEALWGALPREEHRAWQERLARHVVDGSTRWEVFYELGVVVGRGGGGGGGDETAARGSTTFASPPPPATGAAPSSSSSSSSPSPLLVVSGDEAAAILQADAVTARAAIEKSSANGNGGANGGPFSPSSSAGRGRPRSLERATAARARAAAEAQKKQPSSSSPPSSPPPVKISSILGATKGSSGNSGSSGSSSDGFGSGGGGGFGGGGFGGDYDGLDTSKLVPGQRLPDGSVVATDWKGDVMIIRPGDKGVAGL